MDSIDNANYEKNPGLTKSATLILKSDGVLDVKETNSSRVSDTVKMEDSGDKKANHASSGELSDSFTGSKEQKGNLEQLLSLQNIVLKFLACYLIPTYKRERASQYHKTLKEYVISELQLG
jgi:hypothetical protein